MFVGHLDQTHLDCLQLDGAQDLEITWSEMDKRGTSDQEDTDMHEWGCGILPTQPATHGTTGPGDFYVTYSIKL